MTPDNIIHNWSEMEDRIRQFELEWNPSSVMSIAGYLPAVQDPAYAELLVELVRVDLELRWDSGIPIPLEEYLVAFPTIASDKIAMEKVAFEEYRLAFANRRANTETVEDPLNYADRFDIDVAHWPIWKPDPSKHNVSSTRSTAKTEDFPEVGQSFFGFELIGLLGKGACGSVFLARQNDLANRLVSLKISTQKSHESQFLARFQHSNIVPVFSFHHQGDLTAVCMPFLGVSTLNDLIAVAWNTVKNKQHGLPATDKSGDARLSNQSLISTTNLERVQSVLETIPDDREREGFQKSIFHHPLADDKPESSKGKNWVELAVSIATGIAEGLAHAHGKGMIHGDLKPANILISDEDQPILLDFHLSRSLNNTSGDSRWIGGTLPYMSPEHLHSLETGETIERQADIFSFGIILFELLTGKLPFELPVRTTAGSIQSMIEERTSAMVPSVRKHFPEISPDLDAIVQKCLQPLPDHRYFDAEQLLTDLKLHATHHSLRFARSKSLVERTRKFTLRHPRLTSVAGIAAISLLIVSLLGWSLVNRTNRIAALKATNESREFVEQNGKVRLAMSVMTLDRAHSSESMNRARQLLSKYDATTLDAWRGSTRNRLLSEPQRESEQQSIGTTFFWLAESARQQSRFEEDPVAIQSRLKESLEYNEIAREFFAFSVPGHSRQSTKGLEFQKLALQTELNHERSTVDARELLKQWNPQNRTDCMMAALLLQYTPEARPLAEKLVQMDGLNHTAWIVAGNILANLGDLPQAKAYYNVATSLAPEQSYPYWLLGRVQHDLDEFSNSRESFLRALALDPGDCRSMLNIGLACLALNQLEEAENAFSRAIKHGAKDSRAWLLRSDVRNMLEKSAGAERDMQTFLEMEPFNEDGYIARGSTLAATRPEKAIKDFEQALKYNPRSLMAIQNLAHVYSEVLGEYSKAIGELDRLVALQPDNPLHLATRGVLFARQGNREQAHSNAEAALGLQNDAKSLYYIAGIYAQTTRLVDSDADQAIKLIRKAAVQNPTLVWNYTKIDPDIKPLSDNRKFRALLRSIEDLQTNAK